MTRRLWEALYVAWPLIVLAGALLLGGWLAELTPAAPVTGLNGGW